MLNKQPLFYLHHFGHRIHYSMDKLFAEMNGTAKQKFILGLYNDKFHFENKNSFRDS